VLVEIQSVLEKNFGSK